MPTVAVFINNYSATFNTVVIITVLYKYKLYL